MNQRIERYLSALFAGVPRTEKARELREELLANMTERYEDYLRQGKSETEAYSLTVASMGDLDEAIAQVRPDEDFRREAQRYRLRSARNTAIAVAGYILGAALVVGSALFQVEAAQITAVVLLLVLAAASTALLIYTYMSTPPEYRDPDDEDEDDRALLARPGGAAFQAAMKLYWLVVLVIYLAVSFVTFSWGTTWVIWPVAAVISAICRAVFELRNAR